MRISRRIHARRKLLGVPNEIASEVLKGGDAVPVIQLITLGQQIVTKMASEGTAQ